MKDSRLYIILLIMVSAAITASGQAEIVDQFYTDAAKYGKQLERPKIRVFVAEMKEPANGKIVNMPDGSLVIVIEQEFWNYYQGQSQIKRLMYYLLAHELLKQNHDKTGIMNSQKVYYRLKDKQVQKLFTEL